VKTPPVVTRHDRRLIRIAEALSQAGPVHPKVAAGVAAVFGDRRVSLTGEPAQRTVNR
jgi:hypothetical protein